MVIVVAASDTCIILSVALPQPLGDSRSDKSKHSITVQTAKPPPEVKGEEIVRRDNRQ